MISDGLSEIPARRLQQPQVVLRSPAVRLQRRQRLGCGESAGLVQLAEADWRAQHIDTIQPAGLRQADVPGELCRQLRQAQGHELRKPGPGPGIDFIVCGVAIAH